MRNRSLKTTLHSCVWLKAFQKAKDPKPPEPRRTNWRVLALLLPSWAVPHPVSAKGGCWCPHGCKTRQNRAGPHYSCFSIAPLQRWGPHEPFNSTWVLFTGLHSWHCPPEGLGSGCVALRPGQLGDTDGRQGFQGMFQAPQWGQGGFEE